MYNTDADGPAEYNGEPPEKWTLAADPATVERNLGKPDTRELVAGGRTINGNPRDELWHKYEAQAYRIIFRRLPGGPYRIHSVRACKDSCVR